jgi:hypothetical protein
MTILTTLCTLQKKNLKVYKFVRALSDPSLALSRFRVLFCSMRPLNIVSLMDKSSKLYFCNFMNFFPY